MKYEMDEWIYFFDLSYTEDLKKLYDLPSTCVREIWSLVEQSNNNLNINTCPF
jgi:hypothetical protein